MFWYDFSFRSLTAAQDGRSVLEHAGIGAELLRAPQAISEQGCGYVVETADFDGAHQFANVSGLHGHLHFVLHPDLHGHTAPAACRKEARGV